MGNPDSLPHDSITRRPPSHNGRSNLTNIADIEPVTPQEFRLMLSAAGTLVRDMAYDESLRGQIERDWVGILRFLRETGCHPSVLARKWSQIESYGPHLTLDGGGYQVIWNRPKTRSPVRGWVATEAGDWLVNEYHARIKAGGKPYSRQWVWRIVSRCGKHAGIRGPVTPRRLRHTLGIELTAKEGAGVAREALRVSDGVLLQYQRRTDEGSYEALKRAARARETPS